MNAEQFHSPEQVECATHGSGFQTFVCEHLLSNPAQEWFSSELDDENKWPDAWCASCNAFFSRQMNGTKRTNQISKSN
jgi:hypothetical protein